MRYPTFCMLAAVFFEQRNNRVIQQNPNSGTLFMTLSLPSWPDLNYLAILFVISPNCDAGCLLHALQRIAQLPGPHSGLLHSEEIYLAKE